MIDIISDDSTIIIYGSDLVLYVVVSFKLQIIEIIFVIFWLGPLKLRGTSFLMNVHSSKIAKNP